MNLKLILAQKLAHIVLEKDGKVIFSESTTTVNGLKLKEHGIKKESDKGYDAIAYSKPYEVYEIALDTPEKKADKPAPAPKPEKKAAAKAPAKKAAKK